MTHTSSCYRHIGLPTSNCCCVMVSSNVIQTTATLFALLPTICNFICTLGSDAKFFSENPKYTFISKYRLYRAWSELHWAYNSRKNWLWKNSPKWPNSGQKVKVSPLCTSMKRVPPPLHFRWKGSPFVFLNQHPQIWFWTTTPKHANQQSYIFSVYFIFFQRFLLKNILKYYLITIASNYFIFSIQKEQKHEQVQQKHTTYVRVRTEIMNFNDPGITTPYMQQIPATCLATKLRCI